MINTTVEINEAIRAIDETIVSLCNKIKASAMRMNPDDVSALANLVEARAKILNSYSL